MARTSDLERVSAIVLRFMRGPILLLVIVYATGMAGMVLLPGLDNEGNPSHMGFFHAFYFMTYTATTTGFGEIPNEFSEAQRMWAVACLYMSVVAWIYAIGSIFGLVQNPHFKQALAQKQFAWAVNRIAGRFVIVAGFGDTGSLLARGLSDQHIVGVIIDGNPERIKALNLRDYRVKMPGLRADPSVPKTLLDAGLRNPRCCAVVALTSDEEVNLKIAVMVRLLNPTVPVICRSTSQTHEAELRSLGMVTVVDPFEVFAEELQVAIHVPQIHALDEWLVGAPSAKLDQPLRCPKGAWILCGYGRMGKHVYASSRARHIPTVVIDPYIKENDPVENKIVDFANRKTLLAAGIEDAAGIVVATGSDSANLKILITARAINPRVFTVVRQSDHENELAFEAGNANLIMQPSLVTARRILLHLISPLVNDFVEKLIQFKPDSLNELCEQLNTAIGESKPYLWTVRVSKSKTPAVNTPISQGEEVMLGALLRHPSDRGRALNCVALLLKRATQKFILPCSAQEIRYGDEILFCGTRDAKYLLSATLNNSYLLLYVIGGTVQPAGYLMNWLYRQISQR